MFPWMRISEIRGWSLEYTLEQVTVEEVRMWEEYWAQDLEVPDRTAYYLMGVMAETIRPHVKHPASVKLDQMRIRFTPKDRKPNTNLTDEERIALSKQAWFGALGGMPDDTGRGKNVKPRIMQKKIRPNQ